MSKLSAQCDELRSMAESVGLAMPQAATLMMEAADTIERLREQAEDMDFQLDKWQTKAEYFKQLANLAEADRLRNDAENAKLRELVRDYEHCTVHADCSSCKYDGTTSTHCPFSPCFPDIDELRELGVEVTDG